MKTKISLAALAVACVVSGQAMAYTPAEVTALENLNPNTTLWADANWDTALDGTDVNGGAWGSAADPCDWQGIACTDSEITNLEVPNSAMTKSMADILSALDPMKGTLKTLNVSSTGSAAADTPPATVNNTALADIPAAIADFTQLTHIAINASGGTGTIPDMSALEALQVLNANDSAFTSISGQISGGTASLTTLQLQNNPDLEGDLTAVLAENASTLGIVDVSDTKLSGALPSFAGGVLTAFRADGSKLNGELILQADPATFDAANWNIVGTGIIPDGNTEAYFTDVASYDPAQALRAPTAVTAIENQTKDGLDLTWTADANGATPTGFSVDYKLASDTDWTNVPVAGTAVSGSVTGLTAGAYEVRAAATTETAQSSYTMATATITEDTTNPNPPMSCPEGQQLNDEGMCETTPPAGLNCPEGQQPNAAGTECEATPVKSGGGGAALWLALFPLMGLLRRKRA